MKRKRYYVSGSRQLRSHLGQWFAGSVDTTDGWANYLTCKSAAHAIRQFRRLPRTPWAQIDIRGDDNPRGWRWFKNPRTCRKKIDIWSAVC